MRRKDWKTKNLKEGIYGKFYKNSNFLFLRGLILKKFRHLLRKNLLFNYIFYRNFLNFLKKNKLSYNYKKYIYKNNYLNLFYPEYLFKKKIDGSFYNFNKFKNSNNFSSIIIKSSYKLTNSVYGSNVHIFNANNKILNDFNDEDLKNFLCIKYNKKIEDDNNYLQIMGQHFNFNLFTFNAVELYKILLILYLNKIIIKYIYEFLNQQLIRQDLKKKL